MTFHPLATYITFLILSVYLALPAVHLAQAASSDAAADHTVSLFNAPSPCGGCPCTDQQPPTCELHCICSSHIPLPQGLHLIYAPLITQLHSFDEFRPPPQVYLPIFVPPQNFS